MEQSYSLGIKEEKKEGGEEEEGDYTDVLTSRERERKASVVYRVCHTSHTSAIDASSS